MQSIILNDAIKADSYLSHLQQFWLDAVTSLTALLETAEGGELKTEDTVAPVQSALYFLGNAHQHMKQERCKKVLINLNPALKSMANYEKIFKAAAPMLFGDEFAAKATDRVEQLKAITSVHQARAEKIFQLFFWLPPPRLLFEWPRGWKQKQLRTVSTIPEEQQTRTKQPRTEKLTLLPHLNCVPTITHVISHPIEHKASMLRKWLPSIKRDIVVPLHAGRIKGFIENWSLITQDPWILQVIQGFQLPLVDCPSQTLPPPELKFPSDQTELIKAVVQELLSKGAISLVLGDTRGFRIPDIYRPQKRQRIPSSNKAESIEQSHSRGTFQDGGVPYGKGIDQTTRLACEGRSKGCIPISPNTSESPQIPPVPLAIPEVPVQLSALRTVMCTPSAYKTNEASSGLPEGERDEINNLPGQHTGDVRVLGGVDKTSEFDPGPVLCAGSDN